MKAATDSLAALRPADVCRALLAALDGAEGRRRKRKRDQTPDAIGLTVKRKILEHAVEENPDPETFESWLLNYSQSEDRSGAVAAMARSVLDEWRLAHSMGEFRVWLEQGAPSDDTKDENPRERQPR
jgi:hypothetical protein